MVEALYGVKANIEGFIVEIEEESQDFYGFFNADRGKIYDLIREFDFEKVEMYHGNALYWCGILYEDPWYELEREFELRDDDIVKIIIRKHFVIEGNYLVFARNDDSEFQYFFDKYTDGYDGYIPRNVNVIMQRLLSAIRDEITDNSKLYGEWCGFQE